MRKRQIEQMVDDDINQAELENEMEKGLTIDYETADKITVLVLREHVEMLESEQREIEELDTVPGWPCKCCGEI